MIKVGFNISPLKSGHKFRGVGAYTSRLLIELKKIPELEIKEFENLLEVNNVDLIHYPYFDLFSKTLPLRKKYSTIVTIHDVIPIVFPKHYPPGIRGKINFQYQRYALKSASAIITDSKSSKQDIEKYLSFPESKIFVTNLAASEDFKKINDQKILKKIKSKYNLPDQFVLYIGNVNWNKNLLNLAEGTIKSGYDLVLVGKSFENRNNLNHPELKSFAGFLDKYTDNPKIHILGFIEQDDLVPLMNLAKIFLFPSYYEGFGLPILEAQACEVPVITSNISSMSEVGGESVYYVDPNNVNEISDGIKKIMSDAKLYKSLVNKGLENIKKFNWKKTAHETVEIYEKILGK